MCYYASQQLGNWYVKGYKGITYIVCTNGNYPQDIAIECLDELYETIRQCKLTKWFRSDGGAGTTGGVGNKVSEIARKVRDKTTTIIAHNKKSQHQDEYDKAAIKINACCKGIAIKYGTLDDGKSTTMLSLELENQDRKLEGVFSVCCCSCFFFRFCCVTQNLTKCFFFHF